MRKLIPFGIVFFILPESIPLLIMYAPGMIPSTCLTEQQIVKFIYIYQKRREKLDKVRQKMTLNTLKSSEQVEGISPEDFLSRTKFLKIAKHYGYDFELSRIDRRHLSAYCRFMGLNDYGLQFMLKSRLEKHMTYINEDDKLLVKDNYVDKLNLAELKHAVEERGMRSVDEDEDNMRRGLKYWLSLTQPTNPSEAIIPPGLLVFSRIFLLNANYHNKYQDTV
ncbi:LETM1-like protein [Cokeromyces recurvatus]|uniref:LETM1-like protein n=1 Tax=Cokeromyces recurvatus TaxID=90255 RepID=UPI00221F08DC|nr:LETM1-like protein [Cokeromyces recurvatus]KAI7904607.1 LETM1-like protein [Cokeromyces recurvatus]